MGQLGYESDHLIMLFGAKSRYGAELQQKPYLPADLNCIFRVFFCRCIPSNTKHMLIRYFDLPMGTVQKVPSEAELKGIRLHPYVCNIKPGDKIGKVTDGASIMGRGFYVIEASSRKELDEYSTQVRNLFIVN